jgi:hypothetical protein
VRTTTAIMTVSLADGTVCWESALCCEHVKLYEHLDGHVHREPKAPPRTLNLYRLGDYRALIVTRAPRRWAPKGMNGG